MSRCIETLRSMLMLALVAIVALGAFMSPAARGAGTVQAKEKYPGIGRIATRAEIAAWDIDVRPDFVGLPPGSGSVGNGQKVWEAKCASCHGTFGESNEVFSPLVGGTTAEDIRIGRVKALQEPVARTTLMKVSSLSTLWDYINRAMPWNAPKSLTTDEVYASLAYLLNLGDIVSADFVLTEKNIREVQQRLPNRFGMVKSHGLWVANSKGDTLNVACMKNCPIEVGVASALPDFARDTHGNLAEQQRSVGPARAAEASNLPPPIATESATGPNATNTKQGGLSSVSKSALGSNLELAKRNNCLACHQVDQKTIGPSFKDISAKYRGESDVERGLVEKVKKGGGGVWGSMPMPPNAIRDDDNRRLVKWILSGAAE